MYPVLLEFNTPQFLRSIFPDTISIYAYGILIGLGVVISFIYCLPRVKKFGVERRQLESLFLNTILVAFIGGKIFYYLQDPSRYIASPGKMLDNLGSGFVFYGSLLFAVPYIIYWLKRNNFPVKSFLDILAFVGPILHGFGRLGCLMAGCCYGKACSNFLGIVYSDPLSKARPLNTSLYPTQLFDIGVNLLIILILILIKRKQAFEGQLFLTYIILYAIGRSIVEIFRGDAERGFFFNFISHSQAIALCLVLFTGIIWKRWRASEISN